MNPIKKNLRINLIKGFLPVLILCSFLVFFITEKIHCEPRSLTNVNEEYTYDRIYGFSRYLISKGEYYRAYLELKRTRSYYPRSISDLEYITSEYYLFFKGKRYNDIINKKNSSKSDLINAVSLLFKSDSYLVYNDFLKSSEMISGIDIRKHEDFRRMVGKRFFLASLFSLSEGDWGKMEYYNSSDLQEYVRLANYYKLKLKRLKNPKASAFLGIFPGLGYVYSGNTGTGITAFFVIALNALLTYYAFNTGNKVIGITLGVINTFFYSGSIYGGYAETKKYNEGLIKKAREDIMLETNLDDDREYIFRKYGIGEWKN